LPMPPENYRGHAIALFSGGLDSALAIILIMQQKIRVTALTFLTDFCRDDIAAQKTGFDSHPIARDFGFPVKTIYLGDEMFEIVKNPRYGYGKNMNPCIDCHILMLRKAAEIMNELAADFVVTGDVLGQRPKSQHRNGLNAIEKKSRLTGYLLRPLSARLLDETIPEKNGLLDRSALEAISGRSRRRQYQLAEQFNLTGFQSPGGGCLLTNPQFSARLREHIRHNDDFNALDINILKVGRHFRLDDKTKLIVGRNEVDNEKILALATPRHIILEAPGTGSPIALFIGPPDNEKLLQAAAITARYCDLKNKPEVTMVASRNDKSERFRIRPATASEAAGFQI